MWTNIKLLHDQYIKEIIEEVKYYMRDENMELYLQPVQHHDVKVLGWILYLHAGIDLALWQEYLNAQMRKLEHPTDVIGISLRKPYDGTKSSGGNATKQMKTIHVETIGKISPTVKKQLKTLLQDMSRIKRYH